jgi:glutamate/tyrosine decarboxylase-like PLP-dependent enzyme
MAALTAVVTAREAHQRQSHRVSTSVVYMTSQTHHTFVKALRVAGMDECVIRLIAVDEGQRMRSDSLRVQIEQDVRDGYDPWFIAATAGTTNTGAVDPLSDIAAIAADHGIWFHVDAAYGGAFALCAEGKRRLTGIDQSDSLILDPHKGFFLPCGSGVVLVRDGAKLYQAFHARGEYMQDVADDDERSPCDLSAELTRPFRALRFWLPLKVHGTAAFAAALEEKLLLARYFYEAIRQVPGVTVGAPPDLSIVPFRYVPERGDADAFNRRLIELIVDDGRIFMAGTTIDGQYTLRLAILNYMTHLEDVDIALDVIRQKIDLLNDL